MKSSMVLSLAVGLTSVLILFSGAKANAGILFEPHAGYEYDTFKTDLISNGGALNYTVTGPSLGLSLGYSFLVFYAEVDYNYGMLTSSVSSQPSGGTFTGASVVRNTLFGLVGVHIPFFRAYAGYAPLNTWNFKATSIETVDTTYSGSAFKLGGSFTGLPLIAINLEYMISTFSTYTDSSSHTLNSSSFFTDGSANSLMLSVSLPFDF